MTPLPNGNLVKQNESFYEGYGKATYTVNDNFNFGGSVWGTPSVLNSGPTGIYYAGNVTLTAPGGWLPHDLGFYVSPTRLVADRDHRCFLRSAGVSRGHCLQELCELGRRLGFQLESGHARFALLPEQPEQG